MKDLIILNRIIDHDDVIGDRVVITNGVTIAGSVHLAPGCK